MQQIEVDGILLKIIKIFISERVAKTKIGNVRRVRIYKRLKRSNLERKYILCADDTAIAYADKDQRKLTIIIDYY